MRNKELKLCQVKNNSPLFLPDVFLFQNTESFQHFHCFVLDRIQGTDQGRFHSETFWIDLDPWGLSVDSHATLWMASTGRIQGESGLY